MTIKELQYLLACAEAKQNYKLDIKITHSGLFQLFSDGQVNGCITYDSLDALIKDIKTLIEGTRTLLDYFD